MRDWDSLLSRAKDDVLVSFDAWTTVLNETLGDQVAYAYAKGSGLKKWESPIDYVPVISDIDIHFRIKNDESLFADSEDPFSDALDISLAYETEFLRLQSDYLHIPRSQVIALNRLVQLVVFVPPNPDSVKPLIGELPKDEVPSADRIRAIDLQNIYQLEEFIDRMPARVMDRTGLDFWGLIREMVYRVSPTPVRIASQKHDSPIELWSMNRTGICRELQLQGYSTIADHYREYYMQGWNLFLSGFTDLTAFREVMRNGYYVLTKCLKAAKSLS